MKSPIAAQSFAETHGKGIEVKGSGRRFTDAAKRSPSIMSQIQASPDIQSLGALNLAIRYGLAFDRVGAKEFVPDARTVAKWAEALWKRMLDLLWHSDDPSFVYNVLLSWPKPPQMAAQIELAYKLRCSIMPTPSLNIDRASHSSVFSSSILTAAYTKP